MLRISCPVRVAFPFASAHLSAASFRGRACFLVALPCVQHALRWLLHAFVQGALPTPEGRPVSAGFGDRCCVGKRATHLFHVLSAGAFLLLLCPFRPRRGPVIPCRPSGAFFLGTAPATEWALPRRHHDAILLAGSIAVAVTLFYDWLVVTIQ